MDDEARYQPLRELIPAAFASEPGGRVPPELAGALAAAAAGSRGALVGWVGSALAGGARVTDVEGLLGTAHGAVRGALDAAAAAGGWPPETRLARERELADLFMRAMQSVLESTIVPAEALPSPVIQVWEGVLVMPLVGALTAERSRRIMQDLLEGVVVHQADIAILDVTGIRVIDTDVANRLLKTVRAARLLGTRPLLTGLSAGVAQALVQLGLSLDELEVEPTLREGLAKALASLDVSAASVTG